MNWTIKTLETFDKWFKELTLAEKEDILTGIYLLRSQGAKELIYQDLMLIQ